MSLIAGFLILVIALKLHQRWKKKQQKSTFLLFLSFLAWVGACWSAMGIYILAEVATEIAIFLQKSVICFVFAAGIMTYLFGAEVFFHFESKLPSYLYAGIGCTCIALVLIFDSVEVQFTTEYGSYPLLSIGLVFTIIFMLYLVPVLLGISVLAFLNSRKVKDRVYRVGFRYIAYGNILIFVTFIIDALTSLSHNVTLLHVFFLNLTWIVPIFATFFSYVGWTLPEWFRSFFEKRSKSGGK